MLNNFTKLRKLHEQSDEYRAKVQVHFTIEEKGYVADSVYVEVPFNIDMEFRSWGLKDISVDLTSEVEVELNLQDEAGNEKPLTIKVDLTQLPREWVRGGGYAPLEMSLHLTTDGKIDYKNSYIEIMFLKKD